MTTAELLTRLRAENITTWFDLGLFIDRVRETRNVPAAEFPGFYEDFKDSIRSNGIGFVTFYCGVDGVSIEVEKYAKCFRNLLGNVTIHYITGEFHPESDRFVDHRTIKHRIEAIRSFDKWPLYRDFFQIKLERGSKEYNSLITRFREEVLLLVEQVGTYIEKNKLNLLFLVNVCSNPGNISLALAIILLSEYLGLPVINNNHDFYWEGGARKEEIERGMAKSGPRDFFFRNSDLGEVFSVIEMLFPWEARSWISVNINEKQSGHLIEINGHNPANVREIGTAVDIQEFKAFTKRNKIKSFIQIQSMLMRYGDKLGIFTTREVIEKKLVQKAKQDPLVMGAGKNIDFDFVNNNILFLQPTRIMARKMIAVGFKLVEKLFTTESFVNKFAGNSQLTLTFLITGPIPSGQFQYFEKLLLSFDELLANLAVEFRTRVFLACLFSEFDKERAIRKFGKPISIAEIYNIASLILLPSKTEGRGLPIIEAAACGVPIFCRRYFPHDVYDAVIGKNLQEKDRLRVIEFERNVITDRMANQITEWVFFPHNFSEDIQHNYRAVNKRFSLAALETNISEIFLLLYRQLKPNAFSLKRVETSLREYHQQLFADNGSLRPLLDTRKRHYLPGYGRLGFMLFLKSLIDPSYFRVEEQFMRGLAMQFARKLIRETLGDTPVSDDKIIRFYNAIDNIFHYYSGEVTVRYDHSLAYRHRHKKHYLYRDFTYQELTGLINMFYTKIVARQHPVEFEQNPHFFTNWELILFQLTNSSDLAIDDRERLIEYLHSQKPFCLFPGRYIIYELELFVLQTVRARLGLRIEDELTEQHLMRNRKLKTFIYIFCPEIPLGRRHTADALKNFIINSVDEELKLVFRYNLCKIVPTKQWCVGIHLSQLGEEAIRVLTGIRAEDGFMVANDPHAPVMTDIIGLDRFHLGKVTDILTAKIMGIPLAAGYVQFVPAGIRPTLAYPTPVQTACSFGKILKSETYRRLCHKLGESKVLEILKKDAAEHGSPVASVLAKLEEQNGRQAEALDTEYINGIYSDRHPWNGVLVRVNMGYRIKQWHFAALGGIKQTVTDFCRQFGKQHGREVRVAWNGGYMLNPELVGKLGLPESYIGSPLGLIISDYKIQCPPLFNKPAFLIDQAGRPEIKRVNLAGGISLTAAGTCLELSAAQYNLQEPGEHIVYYDLLYPAAAIPGRGRTVVRLAGQTIRQVIFTKPREDVALFPVGITLSFPATRFPPAWNREDLQLEVALPACSGYRYGIEAGPLLVEDGEIRIEMAAGGWQTANSIRTQAARLDYTDMRGPKIALGIDNQGNLLVVAVNGRIRESVGATHGDIARIMLEQGAVKAMGFDPGGSSTLVVDGKTMNISPYNSQYEYDVYSLPPEPRPVGNAVVGWLE